MKFRNSLWLIFLILIQSSAYSQCLNQIESIFEQGKEYFLHQQYLLAAQTFSNYSLLSCEQKSKDKGRLRWAQSLYSLEESREASFVLNKISPESTLSKEARTLRAWYEPHFIDRLPDSEKNRFLDWNQRIASLPKLKNPWVAGGLSAMIPGAGQIYNGTYQSAIFSVILNALLLGATINFNKNGLPLAAATSGALFSVVYVGNILGAAKASESINENYNEPKKIAIQDELFPELVP